MVVLCASWGLQQVAIKVANEGISPVFQAGIRSVAATALLWAWCMLRGAPLFNRDGSLVPGIAAGLLFAGEFCLIFWGLSYTTASRAVIFLYTAPFVVAAGVHVLVPGEKLSRVQVVGLVCAFLGVVAAFGDGLRLADRHMLVGDAMLLGAAVLWGATTVLIKASRLATIPASKTLFYQLAASALVLPPLSWALGEPGVVEITPLVAVSVAYQAVGVAFISYLAWFWLIAHYPASRLSSFSFLTPLFGMLAGWLLLDEQVTWALALALVLVGLGIYLVNRAPPRR
ncbi:MAG: DMT family transporter [Rhodospirillales bacterium]|nr:DMT family transporter [Rhodospirillales bacterium]